MYTECMSNFSDRLPPLIIHVIKVLVSCLTCKRNAEIVLEAMNSVFKWWPGSDFNWLSFFCVMQISNISWVNSETKFLVIEREN